MKEASDVQRATENVTAIRQQAADLEEEIRREVEAVGQRMDADPSFERLSLSPKRGQVTVQFVALGWDPR